MSLEAKNVILLIEHYYQILEAWYPLLRLTEENVCVQVTGPIAKTKYESKEGYPIVSHMSASEAVARHFDGIIIPGGWAPDYMRRHGDMVRLVREIHDKGGIIGAICHAGSMLISAGLVKGRKLTSFYSIKDDLIAAGALWIDQPVVVDGSLVTSRKPDDLPAFMKAFIHSLDQKGK